ncbi:hypothetical protein [Actinoallomurus iriomotensis]|uniref:Uncharacterized protein n=1 Tax=Actinoallomurus iriomotensis TaxID=478107 RepID=A0A9W6W6C1_9ACTN|nr:hypothetical protein [Actinoallomurus iriomotensis]GLY91882.1 hypothetical protein Airi02_098100 [Actinoallomurus iriomotensis]
MTVHYEAFQAPTSQLSQTSPGSLLRTWRSIDRDWSRNGGATGTGVDLLDPMTYLTMAARSTAKPYKDANKADAKIPGTAYHLQCVLEWRQCSLADLGLLGGMFPDTEYLDLTVWLDGRGRPTHLDVSSRMYRASPELGANLDVRLTLSGFGEPVTVTAPPTGQVG